MTTTDPRPPDHRPYRFQHATGEEWAITSTQGDTEVRTVLRQVGWHGQSGAFYALDEDPSPFEKGSFSPLWLCVDHDRVPVDSGSPS